MNKAEEALQRCETAREPPTWGDLSDAADEIRRLRIIVERIYECPKGQPWRWRYSRHELAEMARAALSPHQDGGAA